MKLPNQPHARTRQQGVTKSRIPPDLFISSSNVHFVKNSKHRNSRQAAFTPSDQILLRKIGLKIHKDLFEKKKPVERLAFEIGVARSSIREIIGGRSNPRVLTLSAIARGLGYSSLGEFLESL